MDNADIFRFKYNVIKNLCFFQFFPFVSLYKDVNEIIICISCILILICTNVLLPDTILNGIYRIKLSSELEFRFLILKRKFN